MRMAHCSGGLPGVPQPWRRGSTRFSSAVAVQAPKRRQARHVYIEGNPSQRLTWRKRQLQIGRDTGLCSRLFWPQHSNCWIKLTVKIEP